MTEREYILATNIARCYALDHAVRSLTPSPEIPEGELRAVAALVQGWMSRTEPAIRAAH